MPAHENDVLLLKHIATAVQAGQAKSVYELVNSAVKQDVSPSTIVSQGLIGGMSVIGEKFKNCDIFVPQVLIAARAMDSGIRALHSLLPALKNTVPGKVCIGTVRGDQHDIGKNLVRMLMESRGLVVVDLGTDVPPERFVDAVIGEGCGIVACSALLTTTMQEMKNVINALSNAGVRDKVHVMVGGTPVTQAFCQDISADYYTEDAFQAADVACRIFQTEA